MNTLFALKDANFGLLRDEVTVNTDGADDPWPIEGFRIVQRNAGGRLDREDPGHQQRGQVQQLRG